MTNYLLFSPAAMKPGFPGFPPRMFSPAFFTGRVRGSGRKPPPYKGDGGFSPARPRRLPAPPAPPVPRDGSTPSRNRPATWRCETIGRTGADVPGEREAKRRERAEAKRRAKAEHRQAKRLAATGEPEASGQPGADAEHEALITSERCLDSNGTVS